MTGASKILTVSYGTFSCTLEGFDDPFNTMKAIAEYFRDLAAGDRYFGAEPPVPDAAMLHRIAEREIHRRVEAKIQDNGVILRAGDAADLPAVEAPRPALHDSETTAESVAARLQRIRARHSGKAEAATASAVTLTAMADQTDAYSEDQHAEEDAVAQTASPVLAAEVIEIPDQIEDILDEAENDQALVAFDDAAADLPAAQPEAAFPDAAFDVPEALAALTVEAEAPVAAATEIAPAVAPDNLIESDDHPQDFSAEEAILANLAADLPEDFQEDMPEDLAEELAAAEPIVEAAAADDAGFVDDLPEVYSAEADSGAEPVELPEDFVAPDPGFDDDEMLSRLATPDEAALAAAEPVDGDVEEDDLTLDALDLDDLRAEPEFSAAPAPAAPAPAEAEPQPEAAPQPQNRARARVIRIRRADAPVATPAQTEAPAPAAATALSAEAEAALQAELAALEAELGGSVEAAPAQTVAEVADEPGLPAAADPQTAVDAARPIASHAEDDSVSRLMALAASEMDGEETRRRQSAIAHLKAAVAATQADRSLAGETQSQAANRLEPYRDDLDRVVRPRRPVAESATPRPAAPAEAPSRPTPLVLVSAQRIDQPRSARPAAAPEPTGPRVVMPVRPRRVASGGQALAEADPAEDAVKAVTAPVTVAAASATVAQNSDQAEIDEDDVLAPGETDNVFADATSFQDFADQLGATALPELLEAAAVYCAEVLQRPEFSRPLVMRQIAGLPHQTDTAREDYLRGFGALLRQGRITKVKRGMFALTDRSPYLAEARKLAG